MKETERPTQTGGPPRPIAPEPAAKGGNLPSLPGFEILLEVGRGGMGVVYKARQTALGRIVALKVLPGGLWAGEEEIERFRREARAAGVLDHPAIVEAHEVGESGGVHYIVQEFVDGMSLDRWIRGEGGSLPPRRAAEVLLPIVEGVAHAHSRGVVHRDLKPANILVTREGRAKLTDFGLARRAGEAKLSRTGETLGTPAYMAPEQVEGNASLVGPHTDIYGLGAVLYETLAGRPPFTDERVDALYLRILNDDPVRPSVWNQRVGPEIQAICLKCLEKETARRYSSAEALASDLRAFLAGEAIQARPPSFFTRIARRARRHRLRIAVAVLSAAVAIGLGWALYGPAHLAVKTDPPDADIYLDGERAGTGEIDVLVWPPGERKVEARRQGHAPAEWTISAASGGRYEKTLALARLAGTVRVESTPAGAEIWLDGLPTDRKTSADLADVAQGQHVVALRLEGYEEMVLAGVRVEHGLTARAEAALVPAGGEVRIAASPPGARGELARWRGQAFEAEREFASGFEGKLPAGLWQVTLHGPGDPRGERWRPARDDFQVTPGAPLERRYRLEDLWRLLWSHSPGGAITTAPALVELDGDGVPDAVVGTEEGLVAVSGRTGGAIWEWTGVGRVASDPALADLDGDGVADAVAGSSDGSLTAVSGRTGTPLWTQGLGGSGRSGPALADLDSDGVPDVVVAGGDGRLRAVAGRTGREMWTSEDAGLADASAALTDLDGDGVPEAAAGSFDGRLVAASGRTGKTLWTVEVGAGVEGVPGAGDLDGDGRPDLVAGTTDGKLVAASGPTEPGETRGRILWSIDSLDAIRSSPALADLDGDGTPDAVAGTDSGDIVAANGRTGERLWTYRASGAVQSSPALADLDADGVPDAVVGTAERSLLAISGRDGRAIWASPTGGAVWRSPALSDLDGDGVPDLIATSEDGKLLAIASRAGAFAWSAEAPAPVESAASPGDLDGDGKIDVVARTSGGRLVAFSGSSGKEIWSRATGGSIRLGPAAADFDGDGGADLVQAGEGGALAVLSGKTGEEIWTADAGEKITATPVFAHLDGDRIPDILAGTTGGNLRAILGATGREAWVHAAGRRVAGVPATGDLDGDGVADAILEGKGASLLAVSCCTGELLWSYGPVASGSPAPALVDVSGDGTLDLLGVVRDDAFEAVSGKDGTLLWSRPAGEAILFPWVGAADLDGNRTADLVARSGRRTMHGFSGGTGAELWRFEADANLEGTVALADLDGDGAADVVVALSGGRVQAISGRSGRAFFTATLDSAVRAGPFALDTDADGVPEVVAGSGAALSALRPRRSQVAWNPRLGREGTAAAELACRIELDPEAAGRLLATFPDHEAGPRALLARARARRLAGDLPGALADLALARTRGLDSVELYHELLLADPGAELPGDSPRAAIAFGLDLPAAARERAPPYRTDLDVDRTPLDVDATGAEAFRAYREGRLGAALSHFERYFAAIHRPVEGERWIRRARLLASLSPSLSPDELKRLVVLHAPELRQLDPFDRERVREALARWGEAHPGAQPPELPW